MPDISRKVDVTVSISAFDMGREFARMSSEDQAQFFNGVATEAKKFEVSSCFQWQALRDDLEKLPAALHEFKEMAVYGPDDYAT
mgnify:FL=1